MFQVIRAGDGFDPVIAVTPYGADANDPNNKYYERKGWQVGDRAPNVFHEISADEAIMAFSGQADGWGFAPLPRRPFASLDDLNTWINEQRRVWAEGRMRKLRKEENQDH